MNTIQSQTFTGNELFWVTAAVAVGMTILAAIALGVARYHIRANKAAERVAAQAAVVQAQNQAQQPARRGRGGKLLLAAALVVGALMFGPSLLHGVHVSAAAPKPQPTPTVTVPTPRVTVNVPTPKAQPAPTSTPKWPLSAGETAGLIVFLGGVAVTIGWFRRRQS